MKTTSQWIIYFIQLFTCSVEIIRLGQSFLINWDVEMYHEETDTPALAR